MLRAFKQEVESCYLLSGFMLKSNVPNSSRLLYISQRNMSKIRPLFAWPDFEVVVHAFITPRLEYFSFLYSGCSNKAMTRLQLVQNAAAHLLPYTKIQAYISPVLASLHRLPVTFRMDFKILLVTFIARHGSASSYMTDLLLPYEPEHSLRSSGRALLAVSESPLRTKGGRAFASEKANSLPENLKLAESAPSFKSLRKTFQNYYYYYYFYYYYEIGICVPENKVKL